MYLQKHQALLHVPINKTSSPKTTDVFSNPFKPFKVIFKIKKKNTADLKPTNPDHRAPFPPKKTNDPPPTITSWEPRTSERSLRSSSARVMSCRRTSRMPFPPGFFCLGGGGGGRFVGKKMGGWECHVSQC